MMDTQGSPGFSSADGTALPCPAWQPPRLLTATDLTAALKRAIAPDRALDFWMWWHCAGEDRGRDILPPADFVAQRIRAGYAARYTASLDAVFSLCRPEEALIWGAGTTRPG
ncbi:MAG: hypothetical protein ACOYK7_15985, partial [Pirellulales bacterium]